MVASLVTKNVKDSAGGNVAMRWADDGSSRYMPAHALVDDTGTTVIDPATSGGQTAIVNALGGTSAAAAGDTGASTTNGFLRWIRDKLVAGVTLAAGSAVIGKVGLQVAGSDVAGGNPVPSQLVAGTAVVGKVDHATTGIGHGSKTVTTAGTDVALASSTPAKWVEIQARTTNTGMIAIGAAGVDATVGTGDGVLLAGGESRVYPCDNLADFYIDATVNGEGVRFTYGT